MKRRRLSSMWTTVARALAGPALLGTAPMLGAGCEGSSDCHCDSCEQTAGSAGVGRSGYAGSNPENGGTQNAGAVSAGGGQGGRDAMERGGDAPASLGGRVAEAGGTAGGGRLDGAAGHLPEGGAAANGGAGQSGEEGSNTGGRAATSSGGSSAGTAGAATGDAATGGAAHGTPSGGAGASAGSSGQAGDGGAEPSSGGRTGTGGDVGIDQSLIGDGCPAASEVACIAGRERERAQCSASSGRWELYDACPSGTYCSGADATCVQSVVGCTEYTAGERYCANDYELRQCDEYAESTLVRFCDGHCVGGACVDGPPPCVPEGTPGTVDCVCGCAEAGSECEPNWDNCRATMSEASSVMRFVGPATFEDADGICSSESIGAVYWTLGDSSGWVRATVSEGAAVYLTDADFMQACRSGGPRCAVALEPAYLLVSITAETALPPTVVLKQVEEGDTCP